MNRVNRWAATAALAATATVAGCQSAGLSPREVPGQDVSSYLYGLYPQSAGGSADLVGAAGSGAGDATPAPPIEPPIRVAVAQAGEVAPPAALMDALRDSPGLFTAVEPVSGVRDASAVDRYGQEVSMRQALARQQAQQYDAALAAWRSAQAAGAASAPPPAPPPLPDARPDLASPAARQVGQMRRLASDLGATHLLILGGTVDYGTATTPLSVLDLTIVGLFVAPSREVNARARASAALVDVPTGRVVLTASADAEGKKLTTAVGRRSDELKLLDSMRDDLAADLAERVADGVRAKLDRTPLTAAR